MKKALTDYFGRSALHLQLLIAVLGISILSSCKKEGIIVDPVLPISYMVTYVDSNGDFLYQYSGPMTNESQSSANRALEQRFKFVNQSVKSLEVYSVIIGDTSGIYFHAFSIQWIPSTYSGTSTLTFGMDSNASDTLKILDPKHKTWGGREIEFNHESVVHNEIVDSTSLYTHPTGSFHILRINNHHIFRK